MIETENVPIKEDTKLMAAWRRFMFIPAIVTLLLLGCVGIVVVILGWVPCGLKPRDWWRDIVLDPVVEFIAEVK